MRIAVVHYHLRPGGVTRVIGHAVEALRPHNIRVAVLSGEPGRAGVEADAVIEALGYAGNADARQPDLDPDACRKAARAALGGDPDLWHIHNHALGKNAALPRLASALARAGTPLLLQIHDFAEDGRPDNYRRLIEALRPEKGTTLYPLGPRVRYALLNRRDQAFLVSAGAPPEVCIRLPNPVQAPCVSRDDRPDGRPPLFLYPTRAIRRKNLGELLLWAALLRRRARFATTLAPTNPEALPVYRRWTARARDLDLPVAFELGMTGRPLGELLGAARAVITTSVAEGFGLAFLEPWGSGLPLGGRDLPEITADFAAEGVGLDGLYARLDVPAHWIDAAAFRRRITGALRSTRAAYGLPCTKEDDARALAAATGPGGVDFGRLDETMQAAVIERVAADPESGEGCLPGDPLAAIERQEGSGLVARNAAVVAEAYSLARYGERLAAVYRSTLEGSGNTASGAVDPGAVLKTFADPARFYLLRAS